MKSLFRQVSAFLILAGILWACGDAPAIQATHPASILEMTASSPSASAPVVSATQAGGMTQEAISDSPAEFQSTTSPAAVTATGPNPVAPSLTPLPVYQLAAELDYDRHLLSVDQTILYTNRTREPIPDLLLLVEPSRYPGAFRLNSLSLDGGLPVEDYQREIGSIRVTLPEPLSPGAAIEISLAYEISIPSPDPIYYGKPVPFGYSARQTNLVDWYPFLPPYIPGTGWLAHPSAPFGEYLVYESADFLVAIRLQPAGRDLIVAASSLPEEDGDWLRYRLEAARSFAWSVSDQYQVFSTTAGSIKVLSYAFPIHAEAGQAAMEATAEALALYSDLFGPYPHQSLSVVEADFLDGMEYDGLYFLSKGFYNLYSGSPADYLTAIAAHETAHQWWYGLVGNDQALAPWLDEALCTYSERIYYESLHPDALDWWWNYRIRYYEPKGWVDGSVFNPEGYRSYRDAVYLNGAVFLEELRQQVGDEAFFAFLPAYTRQYKHQIVTSDQFFDLLGEFTQVDLTPLKNLYFSKP